MEAILLALDGDQSKLRSRLATSDVDGATSLGRILELMDKTDLAEAAWLAADQLGGALGAVKMSEIRFRQDRLEEAIEFAKRADDRGDAAAPVNVGRRFQDSGNME